MQQMLQIWKSQFVWLRPPNGNHTGLAGMVLGGNCCSPPPWTPPGQSGQRRVDGHIIKAIEGPVQHGGMQHLEPPLLECEGHDGYSGGVASGDLAEPAHQELQVFKAVGGVLIQDGVCPDCQISIDTDVAVGYGNITVH
jgi:hypothetical protein